jgi:hypothetical protein
MQYESKASFNRPDLMKILIKDLRRMTNHQSNLRGGLVTKKLITIPWSSIRGLTEEFKMLERYYERFGVFRFPYTKTGYAERLHEEKQVLL